MLVRLPSDDVLPALDAYADGEGVSRPAAVGAIIREWLAAKGFLSRP